MSRYQFIEQVATAEPVKVLCRVLHISPASAFLRHAQRYGTRHLRAELRAEGHYALRS